MILSMSSARADIIAKFAIGRDLLLDRLELQAYSIP
jgi:hypothetical protein